MGDVYPHVGRPLQSCRFFALEEAIPDRRKLCEARRDILERPSNAETENFALPQTHCAVSRDGYEQLLAQCRKQTGRLEGGMASLQKPVLVISGIDTDIKDSIVANIHRTIRFLNPVFLRFLQDAQ